MLHTYSKILSMNTKSQLIEIMAKWQWQKKLLDIFQARVLQLYFFETTVEEYFLSFTSNLVAS